MFGKKEPKETPRAVEKLEEGLESLRIAVDELERSFRALELEWIETYDKVRHQMSRMAKRYAPPKPPGNGQGSNEFVDPEAPQEDGTDRISAEIHKRRNRGFLLRQKGD